MPSSPNQISAVHNNATHATVLPTQRRPEPNEDPDVELRPRHSPEGPFLQDNVDAGTYPTSNHTALKPFTAGLPYFTIHSAIPAGLDPTRFPTNGNSSSQSGHRQLGESGNWRLVIGGGVFNTNLDLTLGQVAEEENETDTTFTQSYQIIKTIRKPTHPPPTINIELRASIKRHHRKSSPALKGRLIAVCVLKPPRSQSRFPSTAGTSAGLRS